MTNTDDVKLLPFEIPEQLLPFEIPEPIEIDFDAVLLPDVDLEALRELDGQQ